MGSTSEENVRVIHLLLKSERTMTRPKRAGMSYYAVAARAGAHQIPLFRRQARRLLGTW